MYKDKRVLAVVPARGGSKGIPNKNIRKVGGVPLVARCSDVINNCPWIDCSLISTDSVEIANISGLPAPFLRPDWLSDDYASAASVAHHALQEAERTNNVKYDIVLYLEPTSPLRKPKHLLDCVDKLVAGVFDAVWAVSPVDSGYHPKKLLSLNGGLISYYHEQGGTVVARQQLDTLFRRNGICYALTRAAVLDKCFMGKKTGYVQTEGFHISIDTIEELHLADYICRHPELFENDCTQGKGFTE